MKSFIRTAPALIAATLLTFALGCEPAANTDVDTSTDTSVETMEPESSNTTASAEMPGSNTTTGAEVPGGETP